jgi:uncharacterized membrane protein
MTSRQWSGAQAVALELARQGVPASGLEGVMQLCISYYPHLRPSAGRVLATMQQAAAAAAAAASAAASGGGSGGGGGGGGAGGGGGGGSDSGGDGSRSGIVP